MKISKLLVLITVIAMLFASSCTVLVPNSKTTDGPGTTATTPATGKPTTSEPTTAPTTNNTTADPTKDPTLEPHVTTVLIDPGHGFVDTGAVPAAIAPLTESQINLKFALKAKELPIRVDMYKK